MEVPVNGGSGQDQDGRLTNNTERRSGGGMVPVPPDAHHPASMRALGAYPPKCL